jgi:hypothetical protein
VTTRKEGILVLLGMPGRCVQRGPVSWAQWTGATGRGVWPATGAACWLAVVGGVFVVGDMRESVAEILGAKPRLTPAPTWLHQPLPTPVPHIIYMHVKSKRSRLRMPGVLSLFNARHHLQHVRLQKNIAREISYILVGSRRRSIGKRIIITCYFDILL